MKHLYRYTNLASAIHLLKTKSLTLLNPATWDDRNDSYFMAEYKRLKKAETVLALCFAESTETYHHWRVFSNGADGVRIEMDKEKIVSDFKNLENIKIGNVEYKRIKDVDQMKIVDVEKLPFLKRHPYGDEREFRIVYSSPKETIEHKGYSISLGWITQITLSPWMSPALVSSVKDTLKTIDGCSSLKIYQSTLVSNETWKSLTARVG